MLSSSQLPQGSAEMVTHALSQVVPKERVARVAKVRKPLESYLSALLLGDMNAGNVGWVAQRVKGVQGEEGFEEVRRARSVVDACCSGMKTPSFMSQTPPSC